eukprot:g12801.t1
MRHVDAYFEYRQLVGDSDGGRLLDERDYEELREKASDPSRRLWVFWTEAETGLECKAVGPADRPTPSRRFSSVRRSSAASRAPSPVATELDSDGSASPRGSPSHPRLSHPSPRKGGVSQDDLLMMLEAPEAAEEPKEAPKADQAPLLPDLSAVAAAKHRADAECLTAPEPVEAADAMEAEQAPGAPAPAAPAADAPEHAAEHEWLMGCVARPLEQLLFGDSPERSLRIHSRARELLETPPDESGTKAAKASSSAPSRVQPPSIRPDPAKRPRLAPPDPPKEPRPTPSTGAIDLEAPRPAALGGVPSTARPVERAERRAMWFLQTLHGGPQEREEISCLAEEDESMMNAALETALNALRRKGVTSSGPAAAAQLLNELGQAAQANLNGLCCVPLDSDLWRLRSFQEEETVAAAPEPEEEVTDLNGAVRGVLKRALMVDGVIRGLHEAQVVFLAESCNEATYKKLIQGLCIEKNVPVPEVPDNKSLGEWAGLCKIDKDQ